MQVEDPDPNLIILHSYLTLYCDPYGKTKNTQYQTELAKSLIQQLKERNQNEPQQQQQQQQQHQCSITSINFEKKQHQNAGPCDISINLEDILKQIDTSASPYIQQVQVQEQIEKQTFHHFPNYPQVHGWVKYVCKINKASLSLSLHAFNLKILRSQIEFVNGIILLCSNLSYIPERDLVTFWFEKEIPDNTEFSFIIPFQFFLYSYWYGMYIVNPKNIPLEEEGEQFDELNKEEKEKRIIHHRSLLLHSPDRIISTQFESCGARRCFPCLDLPSRKSIWTIRIISIPEVDLCISNMDLKLLRILSRGNGLQLWEFEDTPPLPTYLLCIVLATKGVYSTLSDSIQIPIFPCCSFSLEEKKNMNCISKCPYECQEQQQQQQKNYRNLPLRMIVPPEKKEEGIYALSVAKEIIHFLYSYFGINIPLNKLDSITLPYFRSGAMENHGCLVFRENELVPKYLSKAEETLEDFLNLISSANIWAHEFAHLCFGNMVTAEHWGELWNNESFATFFSYFVLDHIRPNWFVWARFLTYNVKMVQEIDWNTWSPQFFSYCSLTPNDLSCYELFPFPRNRTVVMPRKFFLTSKHIETMFDPITYAKGAALLRMLYYYVGADSFHLIIHHFLHSYAGGFGTFEHFKQIIDHSCIYCKTTKKLNVSHPILGSSSTIQHVLFSQLIDAFFSKPGIPIVYLNYDPETLILQISIFDQKEISSSFLSFIESENKTKRTSNNKNNNNNNDKNKNQNTWFIPLFNKVLKNIPLNIILNRTEKKWNFKFENKIELAEFLKINQDGAGYYITLYNSKAYFLLRKILKSENNFRYLTRLDKIHLLNDLFFNVRRRFLSFAEVVPILFAYQNESDPMILLYWIQTLKEMVMYYRLYPKIKLLCETLLYHFITIKASKLEQNEPPPTMAITTKSNLVKLLHKEAKKILEKTQTKKQLTRINNIQIDKTEEEPLIFYLPLEEKRDEINIESNPKMGSTHFSSSTLNFHKTNIVKQENKYDNDSKKNDSSIVLVWNNDKIKERTEQDNIVRYKFEINKKEFLNLLDRTLLDKVGLVMKIRSESNPEKKINNTIHTMKVIQSMPVEKDLFGTNYENDFDRFPYHPKFTLTGNDIKKEPEKDDLRKENHSMDTISYLRFKFEQNSNRSSSINIQQMHSLLLSIYPQIDNHSDLSTWKKIMTTLQFEKKFLFIEDQMNGD